MWIFARYGFYSIAIAKKSNEPGALSDAGQLMIRARSRAHLENLQGRFVELNGNVIQDWPGRDYKFRILVPREMWIQVIAELAREQTWSNFKSQVATSMRDDHKYNDALHEVWGVMRTLQDTSWTPKQKVFASKADRSVLDETDLPDLYWDGITKSENLQGEYNTLRQKLADSGRNYDWVTVIAILTEHPGLANAARPGGHSWYAPLHQAAHGGASVEVVTQLLKLDAWRSLRSSDGSRPVDIARAKIHTHLLEILEPKFQQNIPADVLMRIQRNFHEVIRERTVQLAGAETLRLPELDPVLEFRPRKFWFRVPGMYGGFAYWFAYDGDKAKLVTESWCRVAGGSGQLHEVTSAGSQLVEEGIV